MLPYVLTTPVRDEIAILPQLVATLEAQTTKPALWIVVDDGSTDGSRAFLENAARERPYLEVLSAPEKAQEYLGGHVARIKRWGLEQALARATERGIHAGYLGVLDADLELPPDHYERLVAALENDPRLGVVSSLIASVHPDGQVRTEPFQRLDLPRGGTQFFRRACLDAIGGLPPWPGFDGAANVKAQLAGWSTAIVPGLTAVQRRQTATRFGAAQGFARRGRYAWFLGIHPLLVGARAVAYTLKAPHSGGAHFLKGYLSDALSGAPRCPDEELLKANGWARLKRVALAAVGRKSGYARE